MRNLLLIILFCLKLCYSYGQSDEQKDDTPVVYSKWPYIGYHVPSYIAITGGIENITSHHYLLGLSYSIPNHIYCTAAGAFAGFRAYYKQDMNNKLNHSFETDFCISGGLVLGLNYNYNSINSKTVHGFKPFIGVSILHVQFYWGYSFYKNSLDPDKYLVHNRFTLSFDLPTFRLTKTKR